uniref:Uncharacterized protein n=1 Tax=Oryza barthii TaxID=65489 RepID=A0A0D3HT38_9ORYZ
MKPHPLIGSKAQRIHHYKNITRGLFFSTKGRSGSSISGFRNIMDSVWQSVLHIRYSGRGRRVICSPFNFYDFCRQHQIILFVVCHGGAIAGQDIFLRRELV